MSLSISVCYSINQCPFLSNSIAVLFLFLKLCKKRRRQDELLW